MIAQPKFQNLSNEFYNYFHQIFLLWNQAVQIQQIQQTLQQMQQTPQQMQQKGQQIHREFFFLFFFDLLEMQCAWYLTEDAESYMSRLYFIIYSMYCLRTTVNSKHWIV